MRFERWVLEGSETYHRRDVERCFAVVACSVLGLRLSGVRLVSNYHAVLDYCWT